MNVDGTEPVNHALLFAAVLEAETWAARERARVSEQRRLRHEMANALTAIEGAAVILEQEMDVLAPSDRSAMARVLASGIRSLRRTLAADASAESPVSLADAVAAVVHDETVRTQVASDVDPDLVGRGVRHQTEEALRALLDHVGKQGGDGPVRVQGDRDGTGVLLRIEGCRLPLDGRARVEVDEDDRPPGWDEAIGVYVAARLIRDQGGSLWVESGPGPISSFAVHLRAI